MKNLTWSMVKLLTFIGGLPKYFWGIFINQPLWDSFEEPHYEYKEAVHYMPYWKDIGTYRRIYQCENCESVGTILSICTHDPCPACGNYGAIERVGKWDGDKWVLKNDKS